MSNFTFLLPEFRALHELMATRFEQGAPSGPHRPVAATRWRINSGKADA